MNSPTQDLVSYIQDQGIGDLVLGTDLFVAYLPESSVEVISLFDHAGTMPDPNNIYNPMIQIMGRGKPNGYLSIWNKMNTVVEAIHALANTTINSTTYIQFYKLGELAHIGNDEKERPILSCNFMVKRQ